MSPTTVTTTCYQNFPPGIKPAHIDSEVSTLVKDDHAPVVDKVSNAALLRTVINTTSRLVVKEYLSALRFANDRLGNALRRNPGQPFDILDLSPRVYTEEEHDDCIDFIYVITQKPYSASYAALMGGLHTETITVNGKTPYIPYLVWQQIVDKNPWIPSYIDSAAAISNECSSLLHGRSLSLIWTMSDLAIALKTSDFSTGAQEGLAHFVSDRDGANFFVE
ncbi:hypothetical protein FB451DRAFT_1317000 [Mycena latifolia]|nr:hypothetical protein FB451DRAFT_1317000 [Mycena latifolia]